MILMIPLELQKKQQFIDIIDIISYIYFNFIYMEFRQKFQF